MSLSISDNNFSVIRHPKLPLVILRTDYLAIAKGNHCAAKLLAILENWTNWFVRKGKFERWVRLTTEVISQHLLEEHDKKVIQKAVALLVSLGFIRREQRHKRRHDRSWFYWFDIERVQQAINTLELPGEPKSEEDYLKMDAALEPDIPVTADALPTSEQPAPEQNHGQLLKVTHETPELPNSENSALVKSKYSLEKEAETRVVIDRVKTPHREGRNTPSIGEKGSLDRGENTQSLNRDLNNQKISSSIEARGCAREPGKEEDFEILKKREEQEAAHDNATRSEGTSTPETDYKTENTSTPQSLTPLIDKPKTVGQPKDLDRIEYSGGGNIVVKPNSYEATGEAALLKWVMEVKIPTLELDDPPRNLEAYAKAMIWRDGDALRKEHGGLVRDRQNREEGRALGSLIHARAEEWRQAGIELGVNYDAAGRPYVKLFGNKITASQFLEMPIEPDAANINKPVEISPEHVQKRKVRQGRLKTASALGDRPEFEFLLECWQDVLLRPQIKALIAKYPQWAIFVDAAEQLQSFFD